MDIYKLLDYSIDDIDTYFEEKTNKTDDLFNSPIDEMDIKGDYIETFKVTGECLSYLIKEKGILSFLNIQRNKLKGSIFADLKFKNGLALKKADMDEYVYKNEKWIKITTACEYQEAICELLENKYKFLNNKFYILRDLREYHKIEIGIK
jgi:hypothetical protein